MTIYLSRRPNNDPAPWRLTPASLGPDRGRSERQASAWHEFGPRREFDHTHDPRPWRDARGIHWTLPVAPRTGEQREWAPRREQFDVPVNRVLNAFRENWPREQWATGALDLDAWRDWEGTATSEEIEHARRVFSKLVAVSR